MRMLLILMIMFIPMTLIGCEKEQIEFRTIPNSTEIERHGLNVISFDESQYWEDLCKGYPYKENSIMTEKLYNTLRYLHLVYEGNSNPSAKYVNTYCLNYIDYKNKVLGRFRE